MFAFDYEIVWIRSTCSRENQDIQSQSLRLNIWNRRESGAKPRGNCLFRHSSIHSIAVPNIDLFDAFFSRVSIQENGHTKVDLQLQSKIDLRSLLASNQSAEQPVVLDRQDIGENDFLFGYDEVWHVCLLNKTDVLLSALFQTDIRTFENISST